MNGVERIGRKGLQKDSKRIKEGGNRLQQVRGKSEQTWKEHDPGKTYLRGTAPATGEKEEVIFAWGALGQGLLADC